MGSAFKTIDTDIAVAGVLSEVLAHPELWGAHPGRTREDSPHFGIPDIWVRFRDLAELTSPKAFSEPHLPVFYPAWEALPSLRPIVFNLMRKVEATLLGGILITKIPPGGEVKPHHDRGGWHAEFYNTKIYVPLQSNADCVNTCEGETRAIAAGEAVVFDNLRVHGVVNGGQNNRITLIICTRTET